MVYFKGKLYFSRCTRFVKRELFLVVYSLVEKISVCFMVVVPLYSSINCNKIS